MARWVRRVQKRTYQGKVYPLLNLPAELREWVGKEVEIIEVSPKELRIVIKEEP